MRQRLRRYVKTYGSVGLPQRSMTNLNNTERRHIIGKARTANQLHLLAHLLYYGTLLHLCGALGTLNDGLLRESLLIGTLHGVAHVGTVFHHNERTFRQK